MFYGGKKDINLTFMKNKLWNCLTTHLDVNICMYNIKENQLAYFSIWRYYFKSKKWEGEVISKLVEL